MFVPITPTLRTLTPLANLYRGRSVFLICGGPSFGTLDTAPLRQPGIVTCALNNAVKTFRPNLWVHGDDPDHFIRSVYLDPTIQKFGPATFRHSRVFNSDTWSWTDTTVEECPNQFFYDRSCGFDAARWLTSDQVVWGNEGKDGGGRSTMFAALRILYELGFRRVYLLGADFTMSSTHTYHFDQGRKPGSVNGNNSTYRVLSERFALLQPHFLAAGFHVINCNADSRLRAFPFETFEQATRKAQAEFGVDTRNERTAGLYDTPKPAPEPVRLSSAWCENPEQGPCIITGADQAQADLLPFWFQHLRRHNPDVPVVFADFGMSPQWKAWCQERGRVLDLTAGRYGRTWFRKPAAILACPFQRIVWMDCDTEVKGDLSPLWTMPIKGIGMCHDVPAWGHPNMGNSGVVVVDHGQQVVEQWADRCNRPTTRGDQEELYAMGVRWQLPQRFNHLRLMPGGRDAVVLHWTGLKGKAHIRSMMNMKKAA